MDLLSCNVCYFDIRSSVFGIILVMFIISFCETVSFLYAVVHIHISMYISTYIYKEIELH